jgi:hypothetical protein
MIRIGALLAACAAQPAAAQSLAPMQTAVATYTDRFIVRLEVRNPYPSAQRFDVSAWNPDGSPVEGARMSRSQLAMAPGGSAPLMIQIPAAEGAAGRTVYVCVRSREFQTAGGAGVRGQVCGRYHGVRRRLQPASPS